MRILKTDNYVSERVKVKPVTNAEWNNIKKDVEAYMKNPFELTKEDLVGTKLENYPMGVVVRMLEEQEKQGNEASISTVRRDDTGGGFTWKFTVDGYMFWNKVINDKDFDLFFEEYPDYMRYN